MTALYHWCIHVLFCSPGHRICTNNLVVFLLDSADWKKPAVCGVIIKVKFYAALQKKESPYIIQFLLLGSDGFIVKYDQTQVDRGEM
ncbi:hypothetical protein DQG23_20825 [Paenibacillus contaminans]|uniref:Uncharacterized protein n=1 Tax=Paenibacillus contaminans TaxID=450362 RepID=A0A329MHK8_9BACL|nr:hypothetical protein DQG23_20825 [Paenibacillus contaminans]